MNLLPLLGSKVARWAIGGLAGALLLLAGWLYVSHLQHQNEALADQVKAERTLRIQQAKNAIALGDELKAAQDRAVLSQSIKQEVHASPSGPVPADIRAALERLRNH
ncbi:MAG: hypothetical protein P4M09_22830 [Devosia sp.]|nr:hypothetical protein [Devosia sp.]